MKDKQVMVSGAPGFDDFEGTDVGSVTTLDGVRKVFVRFLWQGAYDYALVDERYVSDIIETSD